MTRVISGTGRNNALVNIALGLILVLTTAGVPALLYLMIEKKIEPIQASLLQIKESVVSIQKNNLELKREHAVGVFASTSTELIKKDPYYSYIIERALKNDKIRPSLEMINSVKCRNICAYIASNKEALKEKDDPRKKKKKKTYVAGVREDE